jgi:hypothetical protein
MKAANPADGGLRVAIKQSASGEAKMVGDGRFGRTGVTPVIEESFEAEQIGWKRRVHQSTSKERIERRGESKTRRC